MSAPKYVVVEIEPGRAAILKLRGGLVYREVASGSSSLVLEGIAETLNKEAEEEAENIPEKIPAPEDRETQLDAMVIHHEAGAERAPELHADRTGREAYLGEDKMGRDRGVDRGYVEALVRGGGVSATEAVRIARGRALRDDGEARLARRSQPIGFGS